VSEDVVGPRETAEVQRQIDNPPDQYFPDRLEQIFIKQKELMDALVDGEKLPSYPIDITTKYGQRQIKELTWAMVEEMAEASYILKNRAHRFTDHTDVDFEHFKEELGDALAYFIEICVFAGISSQELFDEYSAKNLVVKKRVQEGY
jgi:NTP pyrophosphatase (non-canonical NTP hydrolase)